MHDHGHHHLHHDAATPAMDLENDPKLESSIPRDDVGSRCISLIKPGCCVNTLLAVLDLNAPEHLIKEHASTMASMADKRLYISMPGEAHSRNIGGLHSHVHVRGTC